MPNAESNFEHGQSRKDRIHRIANDCFVRRAAGKELSNESVIEAHPELMPDLGQWLRGLGLLDTARRRAQKKGPARESHGHECPHCETFVSVSDDTSLSELTCPSCGQQFSAEDEALHDAHAQGLVHARPHFRWV